MNIGIVGLGYVGLSTAVCFADRGIQVVGIDMDKRRVEAIGKGASPFFEKRVQNLLRKSLAQGSLRCGSSYSDLLEADFIFITVGTPELADGSVNLSHVVSAAKSLAPVIRSSEKFPVVVVKSTVTPGTTGGMVRSTIEANSGKRLGAGFGLCSNPEFLREGNAIEDTLRPDRVVIGAEDRKSVRRLLTLYRRFYGTDMPPIVRTSFAMAELIKYANNAFLAMKISYINTMSRLCEKIPGANVKDLAAAIGLDTRIGPKFLEAGPGYGGSCFPKDLGALIHFAAHENEDVPLLHAIEETNASQTRRVASIANEMTGGVRGKRISVLGLSFKAGSDDVRGSASLNLIKELLRMKALVVAFDPKAMGSARQVLGNAVEYASSTKECIAGSELCIVMTESPEFAELGPGDFRLMKDSAILDARRVYDSKKFEKSLRFRAIGLGQ